MDFRKAVELERNKIKKDIADLEQENLIDEKALKDLKEDYNEALILKDANEIDFVDSQIQEVSNRIKRRNDKIKVLKGDHHPVIEKLYADEITRSITLMKDIEKEAFDKAEHLQKTYFTLMAGIKEMKQLYGTSLECRSWINLCNKRIHNSTREKLGLDKFGVDNVGPVPNQMRKFLIGERELFN